MNLTLVLIVGGVVAVLLLLIGIAVTVSSSRTEVEERMGRYVEPAKQKASAETERVRSTPLTTWLNSKVAGSSFGERIARDLARADLKLKPGEYVATMIIAAIGVGFVAWYIGGQSVLFGLVGVVIGLILPGGYVKRQQEKRLHKFDEQLGDMLNLMVNGLRAGYSTMQAMEAISKELPPPICDEFRRVVQEMQLGVPMERALENLLRRIPSPDLDLVITAINVQREVGGNLAEILDTISFTIRERVRIKGEIRVLTSQVSYSGKFLSLLPLIVIGILYLLNRDYISEFWHPDVNKNFPCGYLALGVAGLLIIIGYFVMQKVGEVEI